MGRGISALLYKEDIIMVNEKEAQNSLLVRRKEKFVREQGWFVPTIHNKYVDEVED
jgi:hypothetical protein